MKQFHWQFRGYHFFTCAPDLTEARQVFVAAIDGWKWQDEAFFAELRAFLLRERPFVADAGYPVVSMSGQL